MNKSLEIYVEGVRLDLFEDESVTIKSSVKDFKDIDKVFTSFSRKINIPASKVNNKVFKHYSNSAITSGGFDARALKSAELKLNGISLEKGKVSLESVKKLNGEVSMYAIRFYGALTEFKKRLGEDYLHNINTSFDNIANPDYESLLTDNLAFRPALAFCLASSQNRFIYHSTDSDYAATEGLANTKNIAYVNSTRADQYGVSSDELVGAYKVGSILDRLQDHYNIILSGAVRAPYVLNYRLLLNSAGRKNENNQLITYDPYSNPLTERDISVPSPFASDFDTSTNTGSRLLASVDHSEYGQSTIRLKGDFRSFYTTGTKLIRLVNGNYEEHTRGIDYRPKLGVCVQTSLSNFEVVVLKDGEEIGTITESTIQGNDTFIHTAPEGSATTAASGAFGTGGTNVITDRGDISFIVKAAGAGSVTVSYRFIGESYAIFNGFSSDVINKGTQNGSYDSFTVTTSATGEDGYIVSSFLPKMKVKDFFGVLMKQFNMIPTVTINDDGVHDINFKHYDYYINQGTERDLTKYVDNSTETISPANYYSGISFNHNEPKTAIEQAFFKVNRRKYGSLEYQIEENSEKITGEMFSFDIKTNRVPLERLDDLHDASKTNKIWLQLTDLNANSINLGATFLYCVKSELGNNIAYDTGTTVNSISRPIVPSNVYYFGQTIGDIDAHVGNYWGFELNEHTGDEVYSGLGHFNLFWKNYTSIMFDERTRKVNLTAFLSEGVISQMTPADTIKIGDRKFLIESYSTNYGTGQTDFVLIEVPSNLLDEFVSANITTPIPSGTASGDWAQIYLSASEGWIFPAESEDVYAVGSPKWINIR